MNKTPAADETMLNITFVLCPHMLASSATLPMEQLRAAELLAKAEAGGQDAKPIGITLVSLDGKAVKTHTGISLLPDCSYERAPDPDIIYLPALWRNPEPVVRRNRPLIPWLITQYQRGCSLAGVGTGCWFLAEAGLLDHKPATTHWYYFDRFQKRFPEVLLKRSHFITRAGTIYCTGSVNSLADLTVHFIQKYFSRVIASHVERHFFHEIRRNYELTHVSEAFHTPHPDEDIVQAQAWLQDHVSEEVKLSQLADEFGMTVRTFNRRFKAATNTTPLNYLQELRIKIATDLLKETNLSIADIVFRIGYQDAAYFTELFKKKMGTTPSQYRLTVRAKLFSPESG